MNYIIDRKRNLQY